MFRTEELKTYSIALSIEDRGTIYDIYFDDLFWNIKYMLIICENSGDGGAVLISHLAIGIPDRESHSIPLSFDPGEKNHRVISNLANPESVANLKISSPIFDLSRKRSELVSLSAEEVKNRITDILLDEYDIPAPTIRHLRSRNNVSGYNIQVKNGELIGHVEDFIIETNTWELRYLLVDTHNWITGGKKILMPPFWIEKIWWSDNLVSLDLKKETIVQSPVYNPDEPLDDKLESKVYQYYAHQYYSS